jgi:hypothetical protein
MPPLGRRRPEEVLLLTEYVRFTLEALGAIPKAEITPDHVVATGYLAGLRACLFWLCRETSESVQLDQMLANFNSNRLEDADENP